MVNNTQPSEVNNVCLVLMSILISLFFFPIVSTVRKNIKRSKRKLVHHNLHTNNSHQFTHITERRTEHPPEHGNTNTYRTRTCNLG